MPDYQQLPTSTSMSLKPQYAGLSRTSTSVSVSLRLKERRSEYARVMLEKYPEKEDWRHIRFSDECHFGWGPLGKMTQQCYRDLILEPVVGSWLREGQYFVLEEDNDSGHGTSKTNIVRTWKKQNGLQSYFNCSSSPTLYPLRRHGKDQSSM